MKYSQVDVVPSQVLEVVPDWYDLFDIDNTFGLGAFKHLMVRKGVKPIVCSLDDIIIRESLLIGSIGKSVIIGYNGYAATYPGVLRSITIVSCDQSQMTVLLRVDGGCRILKIRFGIDMVMHCFDTDCPLKVLNGALCCKDKSWKVIAQMTPFRGSMESWKCGVERALNHNAP